MKVLNRCGVELGEMYGVLTCTLVLGGLCFAGSGKTQEGLFESHTERRKAQILGKLYVGGGYKAGQELKER